MDTEYVLSQFGNKRKKAIESYRQFIKEGLNMGHIPELTAGGLIRSLGGWSQVISMRRKDIEVESDERILGGSDFVAGILKDAEERQIRQLKLPKSDKSIDKIIEEECRKRHIRPIELKGGSRRSRVSQARASIAYRSVEELSLSNAEIARHLGVGTSAITRAIAKVERQEIG